MGSSIFDSKWHEIVSLNTLLEKLPTVEKQIMEKLRKGVLLKDIGKSMKVTEGRACQLKGKIINRLQKLYSQENK